RMIGQSAGSPIMLAPFTDGLSLFVTEGIEAGLSVSETCAAAVWAAGSASRLPALADSLPRWVECVTIVADDGDAGCCFGTELDQRIRALPWRPWSRAILPGRVPA